MSRYQSFLIPVSPQMREVALMIVPRPQREMVLMIVPLVLR
jgi:hypothetical protein